MKNVQVIYVILMFINLGINLAKDGQSKEGYYSFWLTLIATIIELVILYFGGFFRWF